jgi:hypothetical protein
MRTTYDECINKINHLIETELLKPVADQHLSELLDEQKSLLAKQKGMIDYSKWLDADKHRSKTI